MATIGELIIKMSASTGTIVTDFTKVKNLSFDTAAQVQRSFTVMGTAALGMLSTFGAAMAVMVDKTTDMQVHILHLAEAAGTSVETMSGLAFAAKMMGVNIDQVASAMEKLDKNLLLIESGRSSGPIKDLFASLGDVSQLKTSDELLMKLADRWSKMADGIQKTAEAQTFFGKNGAAVMLPFLAEGAAGIEKYTNMAKAMGLVFTKDDAEGALQFQRNLTMLHGGIEGFALQLEKALLPQLNSLAYMFINTSKETDSTSTIIKMATGVFETLGDVAILLVDSFKQFTSSMRTAGEVAGSMSDAIAASFAAIADAAARNFTKAGQDLQRMKDDWVLAGLAMADGDKRAAAIEAETAGRLAMLHDGLTEAQKRQTKAITDAATAAALQDAAAKKLADTVKKLTEELTLQIATFGQSKVQVELYKLQTEGASAAVLAHVSALYEEIRAQQSKKSVLDSILQIEQKTDALMKNRAKADEFAANLVTLQGIEAELNKVQPSWMALSETPLFSPATIQNGQDLLDQLQAQTAQFGMSSDAIEEMRLRADGVFPDMIVQILNAEHALKGMQDQQENSARAWKTFDDVAVRSLDELIFSGKSLGQVFSDIAKQIGEMLLKWALLGQNGKGGLLGELQGLAPNLFGGVSQAAGAASAAAGLTAVATAATTSAAATASSTAALAAFAATVTSSAAAVTAFAAAVTSSAAAEAANTAAISAAMASNTAGAVSTDFLATAMDLAATSAFTLSAALDAAAASADMSGGSGMLGGLLGLFGFAEGGQVSQGVPIIVGERGPEIFMPSTAGTIIPNGEGTGGAGGITIVNNYSIDARGSSITEAQFQRSLQLVENRAVQRSLQMAREVSLRTA